MKYLKWLAFDAFSVHASNKLYITSDDSLPLCCIPFVARPLLCCDAVYVLAATSFQYVISLLSHCIQAACTFEN